MSHPPVPEHAKQTLADLGRQRRRMLDTACPKRWHWGLILLFVIGEFYLLDVAPDLAADVGLVVSALIIAWVLLYRHSPRAGTRILLRLRLNERVFSPVARVGFRIAACVGLLASVGLGRLALWLLCRPGMPGWFAQHQWTTGGAVTAGAFMTLLVVLSRYQRSLAAGRGQ